MKLKHLVGITFFIPLIGLLIVNALANDLSNFFVSSVNFVCLAVIAICVVDVLFVAFKRRKLNL